MQAGRIERHGRLEGVGGCSASMAASSDGSSYRLKNSSTSDSADNVNTTYTANLSSEAANGAWKLQVRDTYRADIGSINTWTLTL